MDPCSRMDVSELVRNFSEEIEDNRQSEGITMETVTAQRNRNFQNDPKFSLNLFHLTWCSLHTGSHESKT